MAEEGVVQVFLPHDGARDRRRGRRAAARRADRAAQAEYGLPVSFEPSRFEVCRWVAARTGPNSTGSSTPIPPRWPPISTARRSSWPDRVQPALRAGALAEDRFADMKDYQKAGGVRRSFSGVRCRLPLGGLRVSSAPRATARRNTVGALCLIAAGSFCTLGEVIHNCVIKNNDFSHCPICSDIDRLKRFDDAERLPRGGERRSSPTELPACS